MSNDCASKQTNRRTDQTTTVSTVVHANQGIMTMSKHLIIRGPQAQHIAQDLSEPVAWELVVSVDEKSQFGNKSILYSVDTETLEKKSHKMHIDVDTNMCIKL